MFEELIVRFTNENGRREAVFRPGTNVRAVFLPGMGGAATAEELGLNLVRTPAPGVMVRDESGQPLTGAALGAEDGPGICCIVGGDLHCW